MELLIIGIGGFLGAIARYLVYLNLKPIPAGFPYATLAVNSLGCFAIGAIMGLVQKQQPSLFHPSLFLMATAGFLSSFTTFSAFGFETIQLVRLNLYALAGLNIAANLLLGLLLVILGSRLTAG